MSFVVDGSQWQFDGLRNENVVRSIEGFLGRVRTALERDETIWIGEDFQIRPMAGGLDLWSLRGPDSPVTLPEEIWQELAGFLGRAPCYLDEEWPEGFDGNGVEIDGASSVEPNIDAAWVHHQVRSGTAIGCLSLSRDGSFVTQSHVGAVPIYWIASERTRLAFWRDAMTVEGDGEDALVRFAHHAYPDIYFVDRVLNGLDHLGGGYLARRDDIKACFAVLNDSGAWAFTCPPPALTPVEAPGPNPNARPTKQLVQRRFQGLGLNVAPENPNVRRDPECRRAREVVVGGQALYCEWHVKLEAHRNRIHFHSPTEGSGNLLIVAIICEHLPLP